MPEDLHQFSRMELWVHAMLRVPPYPEPPEGAPDSIQVFHAGRNYYIWRLLLWLVSYLLVLTAIVAASLFTSKFYPRMPGWAQIAFRLAECFAALAYITSLLFTYFAQRLNYLLRWYIISDRSLRIRTGVLGMQELTMTFSNIQEIRVSAGPLQNLLKIADVEVSSAGGVASAKDGGNTARFEGVSNANAIRDLMVERLRQYRDSGLGEARAHGGPAPDQVIEAAHAVLDEVRALREQLQGQE
jgi:membrane protein YdbS with pleckstrin-like domain